MIIRTHSRTLFAIAYGILQNREEAEDVVQDSLVKAWKTRWRVRDPEKFPAWLGMIARHRAHDVFCANASRFLSLTKRLSAIESAAIGHHCNGSTVAFGACHATGASSRRADPALFRRDGLSDDRKHARPNQWRAARNSRPRSGFACANNFAPLSLQRTKSMAIVHDEIDNWLAADLHGELSTDEEQRACTRISSNASPAVKLITKPKL